jgi:hypothetical protein
MILKKSEGHEFNICSEDEMENSKTNSLQKQILGRDLKSELYIKIIFQF